MKSVSAIRRTFARHPRSRMYAAIAACVALGGCVLDGAPSYSLFGAFFPASLLCVVIGLIGSLILRVVFVASGFENSTPFKLLIYVAFAASMATWIWLALFGDK
jgi:YtcA family